MSGPIDDRQLMHPARPKLAGWGCHAERSS
jgi:hypothetical protein